jgi:hypothetical protein
MNIDKISPAPWYYGKCMIGSPDNRHNPMVTAPNSGRNIARLFSTTSTLFGMTSGVVIEEEAEANAAFIALGRNAFDVMMRRRWSPVASPIAGTWRVDTDDGAYFAYGKEDEDGVNPAEFADPFTALVEADRWYRENVEAREP